MRGLKCVACNEIYAQRVSKPLAAERWVDSR